MNANHLLRERSGFDRTERAYDGKVIMMGRTYAGALTGWSSPVRMTTLSTRRSYSMLMIMRSSPGGPSPMPGLAARTSVTCFWRGRKTLRQLSRARGGRGLIRQWKRLHSKGNPHLCSPTRSEVMLHPSRQPAIQRHARGLRKDAQARLRACQSATQCLNHVEFDRRMDRGL